jgi:hypothetical protein
MTHIHKPTLFFFLILLSLSSLGQQNSYQKARDTFYFKTNSWELESANPSQVKNTVRIEVKGHADVRGSAHSNVRLSENRCTSVKMRLRETYPDVPILISAMGETESVESADTGILARDRRVEVTYFYEKTIEDPEKLESLNDLHERLQKSPTAYTVRTDKDTMLIGKEGTLVFIPANAFKTRCPSIQFELTEYYSLEDILLNNMTTQSTSQILQTKGMLKTAAVDCHGKSVNLKEDKKIGYKMPTDLKDPEDYRLFVGAENNHNGVDWKLSQENLGFMGLASIGGFGGNCCFFWCRLRCFAKAPFQGCFRGSACRISAGNRLNRDNIYVPVDNAYARALNKLQKDPNEENLARFKDVFVKTYAYNFKEVGIDKDEASHLLKDVNAKDMLSGGYALVQKIQRTYFNNKMEEDPKSISVENLNYFAIRTSALGLVNVDRYMKLNPTQQTKLICATSQVDLEKVNFKLLIPESNIMINPTSFNKNAVEYNPLAKNMEAKAIAYKIVNGTIMLAVHNITTERNKEITLDFKKVDFSTFQKTLRLAGRSE